MKSSFTVLVERAAKALCLAAALAALAACGGGGDLEGEQATADEAQPAATDDGRARAQGVTILNRATLKPVAPTGVTILQ